MIVRVRRTSSPTSDPDARAARSRPHFSSSRNTMAKKIVLVTGGSGLVGSAIREVIEGEKPSDEEWIFASSKVRETGESERAHRE